MIEQYLWIVGSSIILFLGCAHMYFTFFTDKFSSKNKTVLDEMKNSSLILTKETTIWKAWIGFNASHGSGVIFIALINLYLVIFHFSLFESNHFLYIFNIVTIAFYLWLAKRYWFSAPFIGITITFLCFVLSYLLMVF